MRNWMHYSFTVKERDDGTPWVAVNELGNQGGNDSTGEASVALRLNLCATYADAREIADFINRKLHLLKVAGSAPNGGVMAVATSF